MATRPVVGRMRLLGCIVSLALGCMPVLADDVVALVIGNAAYRSGPLANAANDANDLAAVLDRSGFEVTRLIDVNRAQMRNAVREFVARIRGGDVGIFYYAGHGMQVNGRNYLVPIGADITAEYEVADEGFDAGTVLRGMQEAGNRLNIVILDACRDNPFASSFRSGTRGLARMPAPEGSIVAFAASPGGVAGDGDGRNGIYTKHLLNEMQVPGRTLEKVFKAVRVAVRDETGGRQITWEQSSLTGDFYFTPPGAQPVGGGTGATLALPSTPASPSSSRPPRSEKVTRVLLAGNIEEYRAAEYDLDLAIALDAELRGRGLETVVAAITDRPTILANIEDIPAPVLYYSISLSSLTFECFNGASRPVFTVQDKFKGNAQDAIELVLRRLRGPDGARCLGFGE